MGYIINSNEHYNDIGWNTWMLYLVTKNYIKLKRSFKILTSTKTNYNEDLLISVCLYLDLDTLLKLTVLDSTRCSTPLSGLIVDKFIHMIAEDDHEELSSVISKDSPLNIENYYGNLARSRVVSYDYFLERCRWLIFRDNTAADKQFLLSNGKFFHSIGYLVNKGDITIIGDSLAMFQEPEKFLDMYQDLDTGDFNLMIRPIRLFFKVVQDYKSYLKKTEKKYTFKYFADLIFVVGDCKLIEKYKDGIVRQPVNSQALRGYSPEELVKIFGIKDTIMLYGSEENYIDECRNEQDIYPLCSYFDEVWGDRLSEIEDYLDMISKKILDDLHHVSRLDICHAFRFKFMLLRQCFRDKRYIDNYIKEYMKYIDQTNEDREW